MQILIAFALVKRVGMHRKKISNAYTLEFYTARHHVKFPRMHPALCNLGCIMLNVVILVHCPAAAIMIKLYRTAGLDAISPYGTNFRKGETPENPKSA
jgi:hypothetical protein